MDQTRVVDCGGGVRLERAVPCRLRDGVVLYSDHYYPPGGGRAPTLLMRQPYGRDIASTVVYRHPAWFARAGYNVVIQDVRGRGDSEGEFYPFRHEGPDGFDTVQWVASRPESDGQVGMYGFSYQGSTQLLAAVEQPPALRCIAPAMTAADLYDGWFYQNGALRLAATLGWGTQMLRGDAWRAGDREVANPMESAWSNLRGQITQLPVSRAVALQDGYVRDWVQHRTPDTFWSELDISTRYERVLVPGLHVAGWYDLYAGGSLRGYAALRSGAGTAFARENQYLVAGPWVHIPWGNQIGEADFGPAANLDMDGLLLRWCNHWLKGSGEWEPAHRARLFVLGANTWVTDAEFPPPSPPEHVWHLHSEGSANSRKGDGRLDLAPAAAAEPPDLFIYDPEVPVLAPGGLDASPGAFDQSRLELGNNLLVYTSAPLAEPLEVRGYPRLQFHASTSATVTDFSGKLVKVEPSGRALFVSLGYARSSALFREDYHADGVYLWDFLLDATACRFQAGEQVRLEIASSAFPLFERCPNTPALPEEAGPWNWRRSTQIVWHDAARPATLTLPLAN
jgi:putative CocE/NonD family hydrolase